MPSVPIFAPELDDLLDKPGVAGDVPTRRADGIWAGRQTSFVFAQAVPAAVWIINHNLGFQPVISLLNEGGQNIRAQVIHTSLTQSVVYLNPPTAGRARCV